MRRKNCIESQYRQYLPGEFEVQEVDFLSPDFHGDLNDGVHVAQEDHKLWEFNGSVPNTKDVRGQYG